MFKITNHAVKRFRQRFRLLNASETLIRHIVSDSIPSRSIIASFVNKRCPKTRHKLKNSNWIYLLCPVQIAGTHPLFVCKCYGVAKYTVVTVLPYETDSIKKHKKLEKEKELKISKAPPKLKDIHIEYSMFQRTETLNFNNKMSLSEELLILADDLDDLTERTPNERKFAMWSMGLRRLSDRFANISGKKPKLHNDNMPYWYQLATYVLIEPTWRVLWARIRKLDNIAKNSKKEKKTHYQMLLNLED